MMRYYSYKSYLKHTYGRPIYRVGVDAGFSCPNRTSRTSGGCIYCDDFGGTAAYQRSREAVHAGGALQLEIKAENTPASFRLHEVSSQISAGRAFVQRRYGAEDVSLYLQSYSSTHAPIEELRALYDHALGCGKFTEFIVSTRPDCITPAVCTLLKEYRFRVSDVWVELGLQSANDQTLKYLNRGHTSAQVRDASMMLREAGMKLCIHLILGLPGEGLKELDETAEFIRELYPEAVKIHNLHICSGTELLDIYRCGETVTASVHRHIMQTQRLLRQLPGDIVIQRVVCDTPSHRLCAPRYFPSKGRAVKMLSEHLESQNSWQGKDLGWPLEQVGMPVPHLRRLYGAV